MKTSIGWLSPLFLALALAGCSSDDDDDGTPDAGAMDAAEVATPCERYCTNVTQNCTGGNAQYQDAADCMSYCETSNWPAGNLDDQTGNSIECRAYHAGAPAMAQAALHCPHAGPSGDGVCGSPVTFRVDSPDAFTRVDRMGMPAVSTALISSGMKDAYNDADPADDAAGTFVGDLAATLTAIHGALDDDLTTLGAAPCSMVDMVNGLPECFGQEVAAGVTVASLVLPDTLAINPAAPAGFPNGRQLSDPVIDVTLAVILLRLGGPCPGGTCGPGTLASLPLNPAANDVEFSAAFPYLAPAHQP